MYIIKIYTAAVLLISLIGHNAIVDTSFSSFTIHSIFSYPQAYINWVFFSWLSDLNHSS